MIEYKYLLVEVVVEINTLHRKDKKFTKEIILRWLFKISMKIKIVIRNFGKKETKTLPSEKQ